ncbi:DUF7683 domain-containing protein [Lysinibacillus telephonicus]|uniref:DUF7683 domain-containing protein n=2 Tax=Lysinibacillus telephonicus TaxID=1714840 RepID=A0A431URS8_9BACI|nr:hypothetical protein [Lysinibacillus telephonicus]RTQ92497.1 hypothetical protein EKG35_11865 [Lysinibacillus telephonicus]
MSQKYKYQWRITKYNPDFRDENGHYTKIEDWTSSYDIGKVFNGQLFTFKEYLHVESAYINTILMFLKESKVKSLRVIGLEKHKFKAQQKWQFLYEDKFQHVQLEEDMVIDVEDVPTICKMILRELMYCQLLVKDKIFIHFGWDYYMYIGTNYQSAVAIKFASNNGLYVESFQSPCYLSQEEIIRIMQWALIDDDSITGEEELKKIPLKEYQNILNLLDEHPVTGIFKLNTQHKDFFQRFLSHKMDFSKYEYYLWCNN